MKKYNTLKRIQDLGVVAVVRGKNKDEAIKISEASIKGGINVIEVTFTTPKAHSVIEELSDRYTEEKAIIGAGTVLDSETARIAILNGAKFIVSPNFKKEIAMLCNRYKIPYMSGCMTINEVVTAMEYGVEIVKLFPGGAYGPSIIKDILGPLPQASIMPTGGVSLDNIDKWINNGCVAVGIGSALYKSAENGNFETIETVAKQFVDKVKEARK